MPLCFGWGCRAFQTASHVYATHMWGVWAPSRVVDGHMASHSHRYHHTPQTLPQILESWLKYYLMQVCKTCHYALIEAVEPCKMHPMSMSYIYEAFECLLRLWMGIWFHNTPLPPQMLPQIWESWLKSYLMQVRKPSHYALTESVEPFKLHSMSMAYLCEVFEHFLRLWMGIWLHTHTVTTTDAYPDLWELAEILPGVVHANVGVKVMPWTSS